MTTPSSAAADPDAATEPSPDDPVSSAREGVTDRSGPGARLDALFDLTEKAILATAMAVMAVLTFINVLTRYFTSYSFAFTEEYTVSLLTISCLLGASTAVGRGKHIRMPFFFDLLSAKAQRGLETFFMLAIVCVFSVMAYHGYNASIEEFILDERTPGLGNPAWIYSMWVPIISVLIIARSLLKIERIWNSEALGE